VKRDGLHPPGAVGDSNSRKRWPTQTPLRGLSSDASVIASVAYQPSSSAIGEIVIYRHDEGDAPTSINVDHYAVLTDVGSDPRLPALIREASTEDNPNLRRYLQDCVFLVKRDRQPNHWLDQLPATVAALYRPSSSSHGAAYPAHEAASARPLAA